MASKARKALDENLKDVERLLELHIQQGGDARGRRYGLEVLNKSAIVLITSYWEAYCEDIAEEALEHIVKNARDSNALPEGIKKIIAKELKDDKNDLAVWNISDDKWRSLLRKRLNDLRETRNRKLNTPKSDNIDSLFESAIGLSNASTNWKWSKKLTVKKAREKLDNYVSLRGEIAHRGKAKTTVNKTQVNDFLEFIKKIAAKTGGSVNEHVKHITGQPLWT